MKKTQENSTDMIEPILEADFSKTSVAVIDNSEVASETHSHIYLNDRNQVWNNLANIKFKALYSCECGERADKLGRIYSVVVAIGTASSIAVWSIWQQYPTVWAVIVGFAQLLHIVKPFVPFIGNEKEYMNASYRFERLYLDYKKLWSSVNRQELNSKEIEDKLHDLKNKELDIEEKIISSPKIKKLINRAYEETIKSLKIDYNDMPLH